METTAEREKLEAIIHPRVRERWLAQIETWRADNVPLGVVVIPLLFEVGAESEFDSVIGVACTEQHPARPPARAGLG